MRNLLTRFRAAEARLNDRINKSRPGRYFKLEARKTCFTRELRAGTATFLTMAYILAVNASILTDSGGPCTVSDCTATCTDPSVPAALCHPPNRLVPPGPDCRLPPVNPGYASCLRRTRRELIVATALASMLGSLGMGLLANLPLGLAPGMGANAYFAYNVVGFHGSGSVSYSGALAAVFVEGVLFFLISALGLRTRLARLLPKPVRLSAAAGIGLFLAFIGLQSDQGIGLVGFSPGTLLTLSACPPRYAAPVAPVDVFPNGTVTVRPGGAATTAGVLCTGHRMQSPTFWAGVAGLFIITTCMRWRVKGAVIYGIVAVTAVSWLRRTPVTYFPETPAGDETYAFFRRVVSVHGLGGVAGRLSFGEWRTRSFWAAVGTFLYVDLLDATGTIKSLAGYAGLLVVEDAGAGHGRDGDGDGDGDGGFEGEYAAYMCDAAAMAAGAALGTSPVTAFAESSAGIREGGRTGLTAVTVAAWFAAAVAFTPVLAAIPAWAVGPALIAVGVMMMRAAMEVRWDEPKDAVPAFLTMVLMPFTYSISYALIAGVASFVALRAVDGALLLWMQLQRCLSRDSPNKITSHHPHLDVL